MKSLYIVLIALAISAVSCKTKDGAPGPSGVSSLAQQGKISGTLAYKDHLGNSVSVPFEYSYYESLSDNKFYYDNVKGAYGLNFSRRSLKDYNNIIDFSNLNGGEINNQFAAPSNGSITFSLEKVIGGDLFEFYGYFDSSNPNSSYTVTNFFLDPTTGRVTYDYVLSFDPSSINFEGKYDDVEYATVTGKVDVILSRSTVYSQPSLN